MATLGLVGFWGYSSVCVEHHGHWEQYLGTALPKKGSLQRGLCPVPLWMGTPCWIPADHHVWGSRVSCAGGSCSNTLRAHRRMLTTMCGSHAANAFQFPVRSPDLCHRHLLWVDVCLQQLIIKLILSRVRAKGPVRRESRPREAFQNAKQLTLAALPLRSPSQED